MFHYKCTQISLGQDTIDIFANESAILLEKFLHELGKTARLAGAIETKAILEELGPKLGW